MMRCAFAALLFTGAAALLPAFPQPGDVSELDCGSSVTMRLRWIPPGEFTMGSPPDEIARYHWEGPQTRTILARGYWIGETEVTQAQYEALTGTNPSEFRGADLPVGGISRIAAEAFCAALSQRTGRRVSLPTDAQWEYACRAGTTTRYSFGDEDEELVHFAWCDANAEGRLHPVARKKPNRWGLYDMHGNAWEWTADNYYPLPGGTQTDPRGPAEGDTAVLRCGVWYLDDFLLRSAHRSLWPPSAADRYFGFRVVVAETP